MGDFSAASFWLGWTTGFVPMLIALWLVRRDMDHILADWEWTITLANRLASRLERYQDAYGELPMADESAEISDAP